MVEAKSCFRFASACLIAAAMSLGSSACAQQPQSVGERVLLGRLYAGTDLTRYMTQLREEFFQLDADRDGKLTERDSALHAQMEAPQARIAPLLQVMRFDIDGDGVVTEDEVRQVTRYEQRTILVQPAESRPPIGRLEEEVERVVKTIMAFDADKDGKITLAEGYRPAPNPPRLSNNGYAQRVRDALTLDAANSGELSLASYQAAGEMLFRTIDTDADSKISQQELTDFRRKTTDAANEEARLRKLREQAEIARKKQEAIDAERAACAIPKASETSKVVLLGVYQTDALSSVTIGSQDNEVRAGRIVVEPGSEPIYVVIASYDPTIWQFSGAVERVERLVMTSSRTGPDAGDPKQPSLVGATGIPRERITLLARSNCFGYFSEAPSSASLQAAAFVNTSAGKQPDLVATRYSLASVSIPSGAIESTADQRQKLVIRKSEGTLNIIGNLANVLIQSGPSRAKEEMERFFPGGVTEIDPNAVIASAPVTPYDVLPSQAGLVQLLAKGQISQNRAGEYVVREKIRFPARLTGAHSVTFLIMKGVPYPDGDPGHSCVIVEGSGESKGAGCPSR
ncbi:hypothetical protein JQ621_30060 [Bradyrhizobium manausense]|uniref:EF-hand domain-containing protein n=1 Tax=Bradyrhizobium manausense TaxID=989370 RepID=UPI001BA95A97|nr:EF-hand domain-containing protein [Bradyrhizobium manausense]MBR1091723.1 hypothetical protein [Bradyrhizobium manausense]